MLPFPSRTYFLPPETRKFSTETETEFINTLMNNPYRQGFFHPKNTEKFLGKTAVYRSSLELKFFKWCDTNPNILEWGSENIVIPYISPMDGKIHRYYVDNFVHIMEENAKVKYLIEIKPEKFTKEPSRGKKSATTFLREKFLYSINSSKWDAAQKYCQKFGYKFLIITDKQLEHIRV